MGWLATAMLALAAATLVEGHAEFKETHPAANSRVAGPDEPVMLKISGRNDAKLSKLQKLKTEN